MKKYSLFILVLLVHVGVSDLLVAQCGGGFIKIPSPTPSDGGRFGNSVSLSANVLAVGSRGDDAAGKDAGAVFVFEKEAGCSWTLKKKLRGEAASARFGRSVAVNGSTLAIDSRLGYVTIHERNAGGIDSWGEIRRLSGVSSTGPSSGLDRTIDLDDSILVVGNWSEDVAYVFERNFGGPNAWGLRKTLNPSTSSDGNFGNAVAAEGSTIVVGSPSSPGAAYVFERDLGGDDNWGEAARLFPDAQASLMGYDVGLNGDTVLVGSFNNPFIYVYERDLGGDGNWGLASTVADPDISDTGFISFASFKDVMVAESNNGIVSHPAVFARDSEDSNSWLFSGRLDTKKSVTVWSVAIANDLVVLGVSGESAGASSSGVIYVFDSRADYEIIDVNPDFLNNGQVVADLELLAVGGTARTGASADGITRLLLRHSAPESGAVTFFVSGDPVSNGGVDAIGGDGRLSQITVPTVATSVGNQAFAIYRVPDEFGVSIQSRREITIGAVFEPDSGTGPQTQSRTIDLVRPPLVFVHGLWSDRETWTFPLAQDDRFLVRYPANYELTNASQFSVNSNVVRSEINKARNLMRSMGIATTQVDVIGHSMGGILSRIWTTDTAYYRNENLNQGDIRKLITLDTPHAGSPVAGIFEDPGVVVWAAAALLGWDLNAGAIDDLVPGSLALQNIEASSVPAHALVGVGGSDLLVGAGQVIGKLIGIYQWEFGEDVSGILLFGGEEHDYLVGEVSQSGGLPSAATSAIGGADGQHFKNTKSSLYSLIVEDLVHTPVADDVFGVFPAASQFKSPSRAPRSTSTIGFGSLAIVSPPSGAIVAPGESVQIEVVPIDGAVVDSVLVTGEALTTAEVDNEAPFAVSGIVTGEAVGEASLFAIGRNAQDEVVFSEPITLIVEPDATIESIRVVPEVMALTGTFDVGSIAVLATYSDGVTRDIASSALGTTYEVNFPSVADVFSDGSVRSRSLGEALITVQNDGVEGFGSVVVLEGPARELFVDGFESGDASRWSQMSP